MPIYEWDYISPLYLIFVFVFGLFVFCVECVRLRSIWLTQPFKLHKIYTIVTHTEDRIFLSTLIQWKFFKKKGTKFMDFHSRYFSAIVVVWNHVDIFRACFRIYLLQFIALVCFGKKNLFIRYFYRIEFQSKISMRNIEFHNLLHKFINKHIEDEAWKRLMLASKSIHSIKSIIYNICYPIIQWTFILSKAIKFGLECICTKFIVHLSHILVSFW